MRRQGTVRLGVVVVASTVITAATLSMPAASNASGTSPDTSVSPSLDPCGSAGGGLFAQRWIQSAVAVDPCPSRRQAQLATSRTRAPGRGSVVAPDRPFPQHSGYSQPWMTPKGWTQAELDDSVRRHWSQWKSAYLRTDNDGGLWVRYDDSDSTVSEAIGYGMILAAYLGDKAVFDGLWSYAQHHPSEVDPRLMAWKQTLIDGHMRAVEGAASATDADFDMAYALLLAHRQWRHAEATYRRASLEVLSGIEDSDLNPLTHTTTPGDWASGSDAMHTRPSDIMPGHWRAFIRLGGRHRRIWSQVRKASLKVLRDASRVNAGTGLLADFMVRNHGRWRPVPGRYLETQHDGDFGYNACRTPWRLTVGWLAGERGVRSIVAVQTHWFRTAHSGVPGRLRAGYFVANGPVGKPYVDYWDLSFAAPVAVSAVTGGNRGRTWLSRAWRQVEAQPAVTGYYSDSLRLMAALVVGGNWWTP